MRLGSSEEFASCQHKKRNINQSFNCSPGSHANYANNKTTIFSNLLTRISRQCTFEYDDSRGSRGDERMCCGNICMDFENNLQFADSPFETYQVSLLTCGQPLLYFIRYKPLYLYTSVMGRLKSYLPGHISTRQ